MCEVIQPVVHTQCDTVYMLVGVLTTDAWQKPRCLSAGLPYIHYQWKNITQTIMLVCILITHLVEITDPLGEG